MSFPRKLYIDSRYRSSGSHSDFTFQLTQSVEVPHGYVAIIDSVQIPNVFMTVDDTRNKLYLRLSISDVVQDYTISLSNGMYNGVTLAIELQSQVNALSIGAFTTVYNTATGLISIALGPDDPVKVLRFLGRNTTLPYDALDVLGFDITYGRAIRSGEEATLPHHVDIAGTRVLHLTSANFGHYSSLGPRGESDIIRQVMVSEGNGSYITDRLANPFEHIECAGQQLQSLKFKLTDGNGTVVDMKGRSIAFSIIFLQK